MRLIDADKLRREADHCRETTDAFQELIDQQPDFCKVDPYNIRNQTMEDKIKILLGERECDLRAARGECCRMCDGCDLSRNHIAFIGLCSWLIEMMSCSASWLQDGEAKDP